MALSIRDYRTDDRDACLAVFDSNVPTYFHPAERAPFAEDLDSADFLPRRLRAADAPPGRFSVIEDDGKVVACGGWCLDGSTAMLDWGMVTRARHRSGIGRFLLQQRLQAIREGGRARLARVRTTAPVQPFYQHAGFALVDEGVRGLVDEFPLVVLMLELRAAP